ncbi:11030_t:CDS:10, partial [Dentiscutata erythropus]
RVMLLKIVKDVHSYWEGPYTKWKLSTWEDFYADKYPNKTKEESHDSFRCDLDVLISKLKPKTGGHDKALALKGDLLNLKGRRASRHAVSATNEKRSNKKENSINKNDSPKKTKREISTGTSLSSIVTNPLPNLKYLQLRLEKSNSSIKSVERRFPDNISSWDNFNSKVQSWKPESTKNQLSALARLHVLIPIEYKTCWVLRVPSNKKIVDLYLREKDIKAGNIKGSKNASAYDAINQIYGYMCANKLRYGILSTFDQTFFLKRSVKENNGFLQISDAVTNVSTEPTLLKSISYIIFLSSNNQYSKFIDKPIMVTKELSSGTSEEERKDIIAYKYKGRKISTKEPNVLTRKRSHMLQSLNNNVKVGTEAQDKLDEMLKKNTASIVYQENAELTEKIEQAELLINNGAVCLNEYDKSVLKIAISKLSNDNPNICRSVAKDLFYYQCERCKKKNPQGLCSKCPPRVIAPYYPAVVDQHYEEVVLIKNETSWEVNGRNPYLDDVKPCEAKPYTLYVGDEGKGRMCEKHYKEISKYKGL